LSNGRSDGRPGGTSASRKPALPRREGRLPGIFSCQPMATTKSKCSKPQRNLPATDGDTDVPTPVWRATARRRGPSTRGTGLALARYVITSQMFNSKLMRSTGICPT